MRIRLLIISWLIWVSLAWPTSVHAAPMFFAERIALCAFYVQELIDLHELQRAIEGYSR